MLFIKIRCHVRQIRVNVKIICPYLCHFLLIPFHPVENLKPTSARAAVWVPFASVKPVETLLARPLSINTATITYATLNVASRRKKGQNKQPLMTNNHKSLFVNIQPMASTHSTESKHTDMMFQSRNLGTFSLPFSPESPLLSLEVVLAASDMVVSN